MSESTPDNVIIGFMKAIVNCSTPMTQQEQSDYLDVITTMLRKRKIQKRMALFGIVKFQPLGKLFKNVD